MDDYSILSRAIGEAFEPQLDEFVNSVDYDYEFEFSEKFERKMDKLIKRRNKPYFNLICTTGRRAVCIAVTIIILSASSLSVKAVREAIHDFIVSIFGNHTTVSVNNNSGMDYPTVIEEEYEIFNLPSGFELADYNRDNGTLFAAYFNEDQYIFFEQIVHYVYTENLDNEHSEIEYYTDESGQEYLI
ncbi:MAG: hypothetical protein NC093_09375 [Alistipes sp.]|nr:hypothetical protein [Alistipes sp.]